MDFSRFFTVFFPNPVNPYILSGFILYLLAVLFIGFWTYRKNKNQEDYLLGGRSLGPWVTAFSERASGESAWMLLGLPGAGFAIGLGESWTVIGCLSGIIFSWYVISMRLRIKTQEYGALTLPEFFAKRTNDETNIIRFVSSLIIIFFFTFYVSAQFNGAGKVLNVTFGMPHTTGVLLGAVVILFYTIMGGFLAVAWTDLIQGIIMFFTLVILPIVGIIELNSMGHATQFAGSHLSDFFNQRSGLLAVAYAFGGLSWGLGYMGQPHLLTRFMAIRDPEKLKAGRRIAMAWAIPAFVGSLTIGIVGALMYKSSNFADPEHIMPYMATQLLPGWLAGIFISGAIAAMMSTADSQLLVTTSAITEDFAHRLFGIELKPSHLVLLGRAATLFVGIVAVIMGLIQKDLVFHIVSYAWSGLGAAFGPALLLCLYWPKTNRAGVLGGMITGALTTILWSRIKVLDAAISHRLVSWVFALIAVVLLSLLFPDEKSDR